MKKWLVFTGVGVLVASLVQFVLRLVQADFMQNKVTMLVLFGALAVAGVIMYFVQRKNKTWLGLGLGSLGVALLSAGVRWLGFNDNLTIFIGLLVAGMGLLITGLVKRS